MEKMDLDGKQKKLQKHMAVKATPSYTHLAIKALIENKLIHKIVT